ncbi:hypothetical protein EI555_005796, partial [Monodon monoceros]
MVACIELPAGGSFWPDTLCQRAPGEANSNGGEKGERGKATTSRYEPGSRRKGAGGGVCAHRCLRPAALGAGAAASRPQHSYPRAEAQAAAEPGRPPARATGGRAQGKGAKGEGGERRWGAGERPNTFSRRSPPRAFLVRTFAGVARASLPPPHSGPACFLPSPSPPSLAERAAVAASAVLEMGSERAPRSSSGSSALPARCSPRPRRRCRRLGVPQLQTAPPPPLGPARRLRRAALTRSRMAPSSPD